MHRSLVLFLVLLCALEASVINKEHKAKLVRVFRAIEIEKTRLADGTKFERHIEKGEIPPLPIEKGESAEDLNDPRIGHMDRNGGIPIPIDSDGKVLKGYEYLLKPITIDLDMDEDEVQRGPSGDSYNLPSRNEGGQKDYKPYPNNQDLSPKEEFLQENVGDEYDDVASEPKESLPIVPDLPKLDYSDSGEQDEDLKAGGDVGEDEHDPGFDEGAPRRPEEVIYPAQNIELPISQDDVNEASKTMDEVEKETEIRGDEEHGGRGVDIPVNEIEGASDTENEKSEDINIPKNSEKEEDSSEELTDKDLEELASDLGKEVYGNVMNKAKEFGWKDEEVSEDADSKPWDPNSISAQAELPSDSERNKIMEAENNDGVVLPEQEELTDEELTKMEAESLKPMEPVAPEVPAPRPNVRGGRIGSGVQPDSATQNSVFIQFFIVSLAFLFL